jgi:hypothetical protein
MSVTARHSHAEAGYHVLGQVSDSDENLPMGYER